GRLAVDRAYQGRGIGRGLLRDAVVRTLQAAEIGGIRAILVHAISEDAKHYYESSGFAVSPVDPMTLMITVADAEKALGRRCRAARWPAAPPGFRALGSRRAAVEPFDRERRERVGDPLHRDGRHRAQ